LSFEVKYTDLAARIGTLDTPHGILETPAFVPVVHPVSQAISPQYLKSIGFHVVITNAYITLRHYGDEAKKKGIHNIIDFDGIVMTDSGGYQVLEYGAIGYEPLVIAQFEKDIKSDISVPLDKPTGFGLAYGKAKEYVDQTINNAKKTLDIVVGAEGEKKDTMGNKNGDTDPLWVGPIQGGEHLDLIRFSAKALDEMGFNFFALGSPVELMERYEFSILAQMIVTAKRTIPTKPMHLFGAGHPLTIPLAVALGCDTFDSASYILYAKDNRYMHQNGTFRIEEMSYFPCQCSICTTYTVHELSQLDPYRRTVEIAKHNLNVLRAEISTVKQAIMDGRLWEYMVQKARSHPKLMEAIETIMDFEILEENTSMFKQRAIFLYDPIDQHRPEVKRFKKMISEFQSKNKEKLILYPESHIHPFYYSKDYYQIIRKFANSQVCTYNPFLGVIPVEICDIFPSAHNLISKSMSHYDTNDYPTFIQSLERFLTINHFEEIIIIADHFMSKVIEGSNVINKTLRKLNAKIYIYKDDIVLQL
jgi:7-cyano-7-deazaguanine tRNA-ribosyltransferase